jgi:hypothetical protein
MLAHESCSFRNHLAVIPLRQQAEYEGIGPILQRAHAAVGEDELALAGMATAELPAAVVPGFRQWELRTGRT